MTAAEDWRARAERAEAQVARVEAYARDREANGRHGRTVHSARVASDLLAIVGERGSGASEKAQKPGIPHYLIRQVDGKSKAEICECNLSDHHAEPLANPQPERKGGACIVEWDALHGWWCVTHDCEAATQEGCSPCEGHWHRPDCAGQYGHPRGHHVPTSRQS